MKKRKGHKGHKDQIKAEKVRRLEPVVSAGQEQMVMRPVQSGAGQPAHHQTKPNVEYFIFLGSLVLSLSPTVSLAPKGVGCGGGHLAATTPSTWLA